MAGYRKFRLLNGNLETYDLTEHRNKVYANSPQGLGYTKTLSILRLGDEILSPYYNVDLGTIQFEILFYDDTLSQKYQKYIEFINFLSYKPLYLLYQRPNSFDWFRRRVDVVSLDKTEVELDGMLHCNIQLQALSFWEDNEVKTIELTNQVTDENKTYPIVYPFTYGSTSLSNIPLVSTGLLDSPLEITIDGRVTNPQYVLYNGSGDIYGVGRLIGTFDSVYINSREADETLALVYNGLTLDNPLSYQDLTVGSPDKIYITFLKLQNGTSKMSFSVDAGFDGTVKIGWRNRYVSV